MTINISWKSVFKALGVLLLVAIIYLQQSQISFIYADLTTNYVHKDKLVEKLNDQAKVNILLSTYIKELFDAQVKKSVPKTPDSNKKKRNEYLRKELNDSASYAI